MFNKSTITNLSITNKFNTIFLLHIDIIGIPNGLEKISIRENISNYLFKKTQKNQIFEFFD